MGLRSRNLSPSHSNPTALPINTVVHKSAVNIAWLTREELVIHNHIFNLGMPLKGGIKAATIRLAYCRTCQSPEHVYVAKVEPITLASLPAEAWFYHLLHKKGVTRIPRLIFFGTTKMDKYLITEHLGPDLGALHSAMGGTFDTQTVAKIAYQSLCCLQAIHDAGVLHRDIKPENFVIGKGENKGMIYLIDFAFSKRFKDEDGCHIPQLPHSNAVFGTTRWASLEAHLGHTQSRRDDLESLAYMLIGFQRVLPWQDVRDWQAVYDIKDSCCKSDERYENPDYRFIEFLDYSLCLKFEETPDYEMWKEEFMALCDGDELLSLDCSLGPLGYPSAT